MRVLVIADPHIPIPPTHYGGAERIIALYGEELRRLGHRVDLIAAHGSSGFGGPVHPHRAPSRAYLSRARRKIQFQLISLRAALPCDLIFNHGRFDYLEALLRSGKPVVHMAHNPLDGVQIAAMEQRARSRFLLYGVSHNQLAAAPTRLPSVVIHNFVDTRRYRFAPSGEGYLAFLGRLTENKGVHTAIAVARRSGRRLRIGGTIPDEPGAREYFAAHIAPAIATGQVDYLGPVDDRQKQELLAGADALLFPTQWSEPCAVVVSESLACGTPVIGFAVASNSEIIDDGRTGFLAPTVGDVDQMVAAVSRLPALSRQVCRDVAEQRFDVRVATHQLLMAIERAGLLPSPRPPQPGDGRPQP
jgi:glycosyltransferase involved in cell wall biosynthesis